MATTTITRLYSTYDKAAEIVRDLEAADIPHRDITLVGPHSDAKHSNVRQYNGVDADPDREAETVYESSVGGGVVGAGVGLLAGLGLIAIPGIGPMVAAGWLASTLAGAVVGSAGTVAAEEIAHGLGHHGVSHDQAHVYADAVTHGGTLVSVKADDSKRGLIESIMGLNDTGFNLGETVDPETGRAAL